MNDPVSRRRFLAAGGGALVASPLLGRSAATDGLAGAAPEGGLSLAEPLRAADYRKVRFSDPFWAPRQRVNRETTLPHLFAKLREVGALANLEKAARGETGGYRGYVFADSDVHKTLEAAAYCLGAGEDPRIAAASDELIGVLRRAQRPDGYIDSAYQVQGKPRFSNLRDDHELYCAGHLVEAGVAHFEATGRRDLLEVATRVADLLDQTFGDGPGRRAGYPGHPELELALVRLAGAARQPRYLRLAQHFVERRGEKFFATEHGTPLAEYDGTYWQDDVKVREHQVISGHAVRALYLYSGALDVAQQTADATMLPAVERVWRNAVEKRLFVTGGLGSSSRNEGFTDDYDLPTFDAYQETCASIAFVMLNQRLALLTGDARYADLVEWSLYNAVAAGISLSGDRFFYVNPLASHGGHHRKPWYECACCPPNVARTFASLGRYAYATGAADVYVNLYAAGSAELRTGAGRVRLEVASDYPWDGRVILTLAEAPSGAFALRLREPGWCAGAAQLGVNGEAPPRAVRERGYLVLRRDWRAGDRVQLELPLPVRRIEAHPLDEQAAGRVALARGPIAYCVEQADSKLPVGALRLPREAALAPLRLPELGGAVALSGEALALELAPGAPLYSATPARRQGSVPFRAVPYCVWDNREAGPMRVWLPTA
jgi:DUF1680 family protein